MSATFFNLRRKQAQAAKVEVKAEPKTDTVEAVEETKTKAKKTSKK